MLNVFRVCTGMDSSIKFCEVLSNSAVSNRLLLYEQMEHSDFVLDWMKGGKEKRLLDLLDVNDEDTQRRYQAVQKLHGLKYAKLVHEHIPDAPTAPHVRDVIRILRTAIQQTGAVSNGRESDAPSRSE